MDNQRLRRRKTFCLGAAVIVLLLWGQLVPVAGAAAKPTVVIDPGHGGGDPGAVDEVNGVFEKTINLQVARRTQVALVEKGIGVIMTREDDELLCYADGTFIRRHIDLNERVQVANSNAAEVFLSIHSNIFYDPDCSGAEVYYFHLSEEGLLLAQEVKKALENLPAPLPCKIKPANYYVLRNTAMPAILAEMGYMSHPHGGKLLLKPTYQQMLAEAFAQAVNNYLEQSRLRREVSSGRGR